MRIASLTLWQTRFSRKSHHVRKNLFSKNIYSYNYFISSHFFLQMQTRISKAFLFNHCQKPRIFNCYYNYGFYFRLIKQILQWGKSIKFHTRLFTRYLIFMNYSYIIPTYYMVQSSVLYTVAL